MFIERPASNKSIGQRKTVFGVGINDANYITHDKVTGDHCPFYKKWSSMMQRCYSIQFLSKRPTYKGCYVCSEWLLFSNFKSWMVEQAWEGMELDKDILVKGNKCYSPYVCLFVSAEVNSAMCFDKAKSKALPLGVSIDGKKYRARCNIKGSRVNLGVFDKLTDAERAYKMAKEKNIIEIAGRQTAQLRAAMVSFITN